MNRMILKNIPVYLLLLIGSCQILGYVSGLKGLKGFGFMMTASPLPLVFSHFRGLEPFSAQYAVSYVDELGQAGRLAVTPELYGKIEGPYNYRNTFGAVFAFGPGAQNPEERHLWQQVVSYGLCNKGPLIQGLLPQSPSLAEVVLEVKGRGIKHEWQEKVICNNL